MSDLSDLEAQILNSVKSTQDLTALEGLRVSALGKKGSVTELLKTLGGLDPDARRTRGASINALKDRVTAALDQQRQQLEVAVLDARLAAERIDVSLPPRPHAEGKLHPLTQTMDELVAIFGAMNFTVATGPDIEDDWHNFTALNIPPEHPARDMHDTFYLKSVQSAKDDADNAPRKVLRTHTSPVQIRHMMAHKPPIRIIAPGRTFRSDHDATHSPNFHQVEGLVIGENIHMGHLKGCLVEFCKAFFEIDEVPLRFRPSFFPFTEPSAEVDIGCDRSSGDLVIGKGNDWLEILGCGMVHPKVMKNCGLDPERWQGFAFGMGIERITMLKYGLPDLRPFFDADLRWLRHYGFSFFETPSLERGLAP